MTRTIPATGTSFLMKLHIEHDWLTAETLEEAKEECEVKFTYYLEGQIEYYQDQLNQWEETS